MEMVAQEQQTNFCPRVTVVVPAYNAASVLPLCLQALTSQNYPRFAYEIVVVDDGSTDGTAVIAQRLGADKILTRPHRGPAKARNTGVENASGEIVLFTDADCEPASDWLSCMVAPFADPQVMGAKGTYRTRQPSVIARLVQLEYDIRYERMARLLQIDFIDTYAAAYRRDLLLKYGGFD